jgi:hypothetical protein
MSDINVEMTTAQPINVKLITSQTIQVKMTNPSTNIIYGTGEPPDPNDYPDGTVYIKYTP